MKSSGKIVNAIGFFIIAAVCAFTIIRLFYGAELSDEAYSVAETYLVSNGALPFVNNWSQMPGYTLLLAPFMKVFTVISNGTDGVFLFFRFLSFAINVLTACMVSVILRKYIQNTALLISCSLIYVAASGWDYVEAFRGDSLSIDLLAVGVLLVTVAFAEEKENVSWFLNSGILTALAVLCYPTLAVEYLYYVMAIAFLCVKKKKKFHSLVWFLAGSLAAAIVIVGYLAFNSGLSDIFMGIRYLLKDVTYFQLENEGFAKVPTYIVLMLKQMMLFLILSLGCFGIFSVCLFFLFKKGIFVIEDNHTVKRVYFKRLSLVSVIAGICIYHLFKIWAFRSVSNSYISLYAITVETMAVPVLWLFIEKEKKLSNYLMGFIWLPAYSWVVATGISTYSSIISRHDLLKNAAYLLGIFAVFAVKDCFFEENLNEERITEPEKPSNALHGSLVSFLPMTLIASTAFTYVFNAYTHVYRDNSVKQLDTVVSDGPYQGMRTTKTRAEGLIELEHVINEYIKNNDYILAMDNDPFIYLMSAGKICAPSTWDMAMYTYHFNQPDLYYDYFQVTGKEPSKIIYFNYGRDEIMSIDVDYCFNEYVSDNYELIYEDRDIFEWNYCGKEITCELLIFAHK